jgi:hypothetical protein
MELFLAASELFSVAYGFNLNQGGPTQKKSPTGLELDQGDARWLLTI